MNNPTQHTFDLHALQATEDERHRNEARAANTDYGCCCLCGRAVNPKRATWVDCINGELEAVSQELPEDHELRDERRPGYMGSFLVGPYCQRKIPARFKFKI